LLFFVGAYTVHPSAELSANEGIWEGYNGEWRYVSRLLITMAAEIPDAWERI
jgi:hypothetical protein